MFLPPLRGSLWYFLLAVGYALLHPRLGSFHRLRGSVFAASCAPDGRLQAVTNIPPCGRQRLCFCFKTTAVPTERNPPVLNCEAAIAPRSGRQPPNRASLAYGLWIQSFRTTSFAAAQRMTTAEQTEANRFTELKA